MRPTSHWPAPPAACSHRADGTLPSLIQTLDNVPAQFRSVLEHSRRQGQRGMQSGHVLRRLTNFEETAEQRELRLRGSMDGELSPAQHVLLLALWHLMQRLEKQQVSTQNIRDHFVAELRHTTIEGGHFSGLRDLREEGYIVGVHKKGTRNQQYRLTEAGREYAERHADSVPVTELLK